VEAAVLFGSRSELPSISGLYPAIRVLFIDELLEALAAREPGSPFVAALTPLHAPLPELAREVRNHFSRIKKNHELRQDDRRVLTEIFVNLLLQRFKSKDLNEIREMIGELTPIHETRAGQQLLEEGLQKGLQEGRQEALAAMVRRMASKGRSPAEISEWTDLPIDEVERLLGAEGE